MKLILIDPPGGQPGLNAGLAYLAASINKTNHELKVVDLNNYRIPGEDLIQFIEEFNPDAVGISVKTATFLSSSRLAKSIRTKFPEIKLIAGGPHVTLYPEEIIQDVPEFDLALPGECEASLIKLLDSIESKSAILKLEKELPTKLDYITWPDFTTHLGVDFARFNYPMVTSRGCPYGCIFCSVGLVSGRRWRYRSPESVVAELAAAYEKYNIREFDILDDTFTQDPDRAAQICELLIKRGPSLAWSCPNGVRADKINKNLLKLMRRAGCHTITYGVETADPEIFDSIRKGEKLEDVERAITLTREAGIRVGGYFIIGLPGDSYNKTIAALEYAIRINLDWAHFNILAPYPGTKIYDQIKEEGRFLADYREAQHFAAEIKPVFEMPGYSAKEMSRAFKVVHTRQKLYHLMLNKDMSPTRTRWAISWLRFKYDRKNHIADIKRDIVDSGSVIPTLVKLAVFEMKSGPKVKISKQSSGAKGAGSGKLKVMLVNDIGGAAGGTEVVVEELARGLSDMGHKVTLLHSSGQPLEDSPAEHVLVRGISDRNPGEDLEKDFKSAIKAFKPDVIHLHNVRNPESVRIARENAPSVRTVHDHYSICPTLNKLFVNRARCEMKTGIACVMRLLDGGCCLIGRRPAILLKELNFKMREIEESRKLDAVLVTTPFMQDELEMNGFNNVHVLPLHAPALEACPSASNGSEPMVLWAGRAVMPDKGPDMFLDALYRMRLKAKAVIAGDGPALDFLKKKAAELKIADRVEFVGELDRSEVLSLMDEACVVAVTSMWPEPMCMVGIEAMGRGKPVVAFDTGGISYWLKDRENGYLVQPGNTRAFALRLERLLLSSTTRKTFGERGMKSVRDKFTKKAHMERTMEIYREAVNV